jgi:hypothetical protein
MVEASKSPEQWRQFKDSRKALCPPSADLSHEELVYSSLLHNRGEDREVPEEQQQKEKALEAISDDNDGNGDMERERNKEKERRGQGR